MIGTARAGGDLREGLRIALSPAQLSAVLDGEAVGPERGVSDCLVPIASANLAGAVRVATVRAGRIALMKHEAWSGIRIGDLRVGCPLGLSDGMLRARMVDLVAGNDITQFTSSFSDLLTAERAVTQALRIKRAVIANWSRTTPRGRALSFDLDIGRVIGRGLSRGDGAARPMTRIEVFLQKETYNGNPHFIVKSRPSP